MLLSVSLNRNMVSMAIMGFTSGPYCVMKVGHYELVRHACKR